MVIKFQVVWLDTYFNERQNAIISQNMAEKIFVNFIHKECIRQLMRNKSNSHREINIPDMKKFDHSVDYNKLKIVQYIFEDSNLIKRNNEIS